MAQLRFKLFGTEFYISFLFAAVITAILAFDRTGFALPLIFAVVMHEGGHLLVMWILDCSPKRVRLVPAALEITAAFGCSRKKEIAVALAGPAVNLVLFFTLWFNFLAYKGEQTLIYALINLLICIFNMLPVTGLDGGTVLFSLLARRKTPERAALIMRVINLSLAAVLISAAVYLCFHGKVNISLFITALYLIVISIIKM